MASPKLWKISEVNSAIRELVENSLLPIWVEGEVGTLNIHRSGHVYMTLKDKRCQLQTVFFGGAARARQMGLAPGTQVEAYGKLTVYEVRGEYQLSLKMLRPLGLGELRRKFEELKNRLEAEGLFDPELKKKIPLLPSRIGVITSPGGAAIRDFLQIIERRFPNINIRIYPAPVQGKGAEKQLAAGINFFNRNDTVDVIVLTRGGGSLEDLWPFNEETLAKAIASSKIPVISAVGHETDFSISDFTADLRVPTPSAAAELVIGRREEFIEKIENLRKIMLSEVKLQMEYTSGRFKSASESYVFREPAYMLREKQQTLDGFQGRMDGAAKDLADKYSARLNRAKTRFMYESSGEIKRSGEKIRELERTMTACLDRSLERNTASVFNLDAKLSALNPLSVLKRGYSVTIDAETGKHVSDPELPAGKKLKTLVSGGVIESEVVSGHSQSVSDSIKEAF